MYVKSGFAQRSEKSILEITFRKNDVTIGIFLFNLQSILCW